MRPIQRVLLVMKSESYKARDFIQAAAKLGIDLIVGTDQPDVLAEFKSGRTLHLNFNDIDDGVRVITEYHLDRPIDAVVAVEDEGTVMAARAGRRLGLAANPEESVVAAENKAVMREVLAAAGLEGPWHRQFSLTSNPERCAAEVSFPCVLKPLFLAGSRGVIRACNEVEFTAAFRRIEEILNDPALQARGGSMAGQILVEAFIPGREVALEGLIGEGEFRLLAFFDKPEPMDGPFFEETLFITPSRHSPAVQARALSLAGESVKALGLRTGAVHVELRIEGDVPRLLEVSPRTIGGHCSRILNFGAGMSLEELVLRQALGMAPEGIEREDSAAGVMMIPIPRAGTLGGVAGLDQAKAVDCIVEIEISIPLGGEIVTLPEGYRYLGFIFAKGDNPDQVEGALRDAHQLLRFTID